MSKLQINAIILVALCAVWLAVIKQIPYGQFNTRIVEDFREIPLRISDWESNEARSKVTYNKLLSSCTILDRTYINSRGDRADLTIVYGSSLSDLHQPEICLGGGGWSTKTRRIVTVRPKRARSFNATLNWMSEGSSGVERITLYWFNSPRIKVTALPSYKIKMYLSRIAHRRFEGAALVRVFVTSPGDKAMSEETAVRFAQSVVPYIDTMMAKAPVTKAR